jgi:hypothetical protein
MRVKSSYILPQGVKDELLFIQDNKRREKEGMFNLEHTNQFIFDVAAARVTDWKVISPSVSFVNCQHRCIARWPGIAGRELAKHMSFRLTTDVKVRFFDPQSHWQRGTNEEHERPLTSVPSEENQLGRL